MLSDWIAVIDADSESRQQLEVCKAHRPSLKGLIDCTDPKNADASACHEVDFFPAFCHVPTNSCVYGFRGDLASMESLTSLNVSKTTQK